MSSDRFEREREHGRYLASAETDAQWGWGTPAGRKRMERRALLIAGAVDLKEGMHVLEIGCGTGLFTVRFAKTGASLVSVDLATELLEQARHRLQGAENVEFALRPFEECSDVGPFDAIVGSSVLHHLELPRAINKIYELLKPGGQWAFAEPNYLNPQVFLERRFRKLFPYVSPDETAFVRWCICKQISDVGFIDVEAQPFDWLHPATPSFCIPLVSGLGTIFEHLPGLREFSGSLLLSGIKPA